MTGGEEEPKKVESKGFAGLSSLVSDVDTSPPPPPAPKKEPAAAAPSTGRHGLQPAQLQPQPSQQRQTYQEPAQPRSGDSLGGKWLLGVVVVFGVVFWLLGLSNKNEDSSSLTNATTIQAQKNSQRGTPNKTEESVAPKFGDYSSEIYSGQRAKVNLITDFDKNFKTRIRKTQAEPINFAGEYILATWGCGMDCLMGVAVSARTGQVIELPGTACCWKSAGEKIIFKKNSRLLVLAGLINETGQHGAHFYELKNNEFFHVKTIPVKEDEPSDNSATLAPAPSNQNAASAYSPTPELPQQSASPAEDKPPIGSSLVLSTAQIRYCLAEDIRVEAAKAVVNSNSDGDVERFNAMVADYNSRCGSFRYRSGTLESARRDIEPYRSQFQSEGRSRFARSPSTGSLSTPAPSRPAADATVQAIQRKLNELGYDAGTADGLMGQGTLSAIFAFQRDNGLVADGNATVALLQLLTTSRQGDRQEAQVPATSLAVVPPIYTPPARAPSRQESASPTSGGIPQNAHLNYLGNGWECNRGYYRAGNECQPVQMPRYATLDVYGSGWVCQRGYFKSGNECQPVQMPQNATLDVYGSGWVCQRGYYRSANECLPVQMPRYATLDVYGSGWVCQRGHYKSGNECLPVQMPPNATLDVYGSGWVCQRGFYKSVNQCLPVQTPQNATLDVYGSGWVCIRGYTRVGDSCAAN